MWEIKEILLQGGWEKSYHDFVVSVKMTEIFINVVVFSLILLSFSPIGERKAV
jgi:hypothetical protein